MSQPDRVEGGRALRVAKAILLFSGAASLGAGCGLPPFSGRAGGMRSGVGNVRPECFWNESHVVSGYTGKIKVERRGTAMTIVLNVDGMMCDACAGHVRRALEALAGVESAKVSLADHRAYIDFDDSTLGVDALVAAVAEEGYTASNAA